MRQRKIRFTRSEVIHVSKTAHCGLVRGCLDSGDGEVFARIYAPRIYHWCLSAVSEIDMSDGSTYGFSSWEERWRRILAMVDTYPKTQRK